jgi:hypothetical protein
MRRRDTYLGGGTILRQGEDGLEWTSSDPAEARKEHQRSKRWDNKTPTRREIERQAKDDDIAEGKLIRSFISQCATAYAAGNLDASRPEPPRSLKKRIMKSGGNVAWLGAPMANFPPSSMVGLRTRTKRWLSPKTGLASTRNTLWWWSGPTVS